MNTKQNALKLNRITFTYDLSEVRSLRSLLLRRGAQAKKMIIFDELELTLKKGQRLALLGPNGCGKSTLCALLAGHLQETKGVILRHGKIRSYLHGHAKLYDDLSVQTYLDVFLSLQWPDIDKGQLLEERFSILNVCDLKHMTTHPVKVLSAGMMAKLHLSAYTAFANDILIIDEGLSSLEFSFHEILKKRLERSLGEQGLLIIVEHQKDLLNLYCNEGLLLAQKTIVVKPLDQCSEI